MESLHEKIAKRAYEIFQARGGVHGYHLDDWFQAEKEILGSIEASSVQPKNTAKTSTTSTTTVKVKTGGLTKKKASSRK